MGTTSITAVVPAGRSPLLFIVRLICGPPAIDPAIHFVEFRLTGQPADEGDGGADEDEHHAVTPPSKPPNSSSISSVNPVRRTSPGVSMAAIVGERPTVSRPGGVGGWRARERPRRSVERRGWCRCTRAVPVRWRRPRRACSGRGVRRLVARYPRRQCAKSVPRGALIGCIWLLAIYCAAL